MIKLYRRRLETFLEYVGEPSEDPIRNNIFLIISIIYLLIGGMIYYFDDSQIVIMLKYDKGILRLIAISALLGFSYVMIVCWVALANKKYWNKKEKTRGSKNCWLILKILFIVIFLFESMKDFILYILREPKQDVVINYIPEISIAFLLSWVIMMIELSVWTIVLIPICEFLKVGVTIEFICLVMAISCIGLFFFLSKKLSYFSIALELKFQTKKKLEKVGVRNVKKMIKSLPIRRQMEHIKEKKCKRFDRQFRQTRLLFYVAMVFFLLSVHIEETDIYGQVIANQFIGVATLAALLREVGARENCESIEKM